MLVEEKAPGHLFGDVADETHLVQRQLVLSCRALHTFNEDIVLNFSEKLHNCSVKTIKMTFIRITRPA